MKVLRTSGVWIAGVSLVVGLGAVAAYAQPRPGERPQLPQEAYTACSGKRAADACSVSFRGQSMNGTCAQAPDDASKLFCRLENMPPPPR